MEIKALIYKEELDSSEKILIETKVFEDVEDIWDSKIRDWEYKTVLNYDNEYNLIDYDTGPYFNIYYIDDKNNIIEYVDMTDAIYNI